VYLVWGSTYLGIKVAVRTLPPFAAAGVRFLLAGVILGSILLLLGRTLRARPRELAGAVLLGVLMLAAGVGLVHLAETRIDSSVAAMIAGSVPLQVVLWRLLARERVRRATWVAATAGLVGLALVVLPGGLDGSSTAVGLLTMIIATLSWSRGSFLATRVRLPPDPFVTTTIQMLTAGIVLTAVATALGDWGEISRADLQRGPLLAVVYLAVAGSVVGLTAYVWLLHHAPISRVVTHQYVNPLVAIALGAAFLDERPAVATLVGAAIVLAAVVATLRSESAGAPVSAGPEAAVPRETRADPSASAGRRVSLRGRRARPRGAR
jgi:drug/metabolite transporter (DMT)-like permease